MGDSAELQAAGEGWGGMLPSGGSWRQTISAWWSKQAERRQALMPKRDVGLVNRKLTRNEGPCHDERGQSMDRRPVYISSEGGSSPVQYSPVRKKISLRVGVGGGWMSRKIKTGWRLRCAVDY